VRMGDNVHVVNLPLIVVVVASAALKGGLRTAPGGIVRRHDKQHVAVVVEKVPHGLVVVRRGRLPHVVRFGGEITPPHMYSHQDCCCGCYCVFVVGVELYIIIIVDGCLAYYSL